MSKSRNPKGEVEALIRSGVIDVDYMDKLSPDEAAWLRKFNSEYHAGIFHPDKAQRLHKDADQKRECERRRKQHERDVYSEGINKTHLESEEMSNQEATRAARFVGEKKAKKVKKGKLDV